MHFHSRTFNNLSLKKFIEAFKPVLFDVSLRDGLQPLSAELYPTVKKIELLNEILSKNPAKIEVGSLVSPKILPILSDSIEIHKKAKEICDLRENNVDVYMLIPSIKKVEEALSHNVTNMSFITSVSDIFQTKNVNKTLDVTKMEFEQIEKMLPQHINTKLYISCIHECPISGIIPHEIIIKEIMHYFSHFQFDELCLSDTCGTLKGEEFCRIVNDLKYMGMDVSKLSVHLHVNDEKETVKIIHNCITNRINKFDVSILDGGGCSVTMKGKKQMHSNLNYWLFEKAVKEWVDQNQYYDI
jgi:hydroxymethylglutaryl-CoA lyase